MMEEQYLASRNEPGLEEHDFINETEFDFDEEAAIQAAEVRYEQYLERMGEHGT